MISSKTILEGFKRLLSRKTIISISGPSGTGKTTLVQYLVGTFLTEVNPYEDCCVWVQASEPFSKKRLEKMFEYSPEKLDYLIHNIFLTPKDKICGSYNEQLEVIKNLSKEDAILPPNLRFIVIDNISHQLRYEISKISEINIKISILNDFFNSQLFPLIMICKNDNINLILIHEITYDPNLNKEVVFFRKLYDRINSIDIELSRNLNTKQKIMKIKVNDFTWISKYHLVDDGIKWEEFI